ncbi:DNA gyrase subunit A [subsurface metagenome]
MFEIPEATRQSRGQSIKTLLSISNNEEITAVVSFKGFKEEKYLFMATSKGIVKKVSISDFSNAKTRGIMAINLDKGDKLESAMLTRGKDDILLITRRGQALRFHEETVRATGRSSRGVIGIRLGKNDELTGVALVDNKGSMLLISQYGFGKRIAYDNFIPHGRGTRGQTCYGISEKTGEVIGALSVKRGDSLVCITSQGKTIRLRLNEIPVLGKTAMGVRLVRISRPVMVMGIARIAKTKA